MAGTPVTINLGGWGGSGDDSAIEQVVKLLNELVDDMETFRAAMATANGAAINIANLTARRVQLIEQILLSVSPGTPDVTPASIVVTAGDAQSAAPATAITTPLKVTVANAASTALAGIVVLWSSSDPDSILSGNQSITNASGEATMPYTTGTLVGDYVVTATVQGVPSLSAAFDVTTVAGAAAVINANSALDQSAATSAAVAVPPSVIVTDEYGNPVEGETVTFAVTAGSGSSDPATVDSDADGIATLTSWTLGASAGLNTLTATAAGLTNSPITFNANGVASAPTQIAIQSGGAQTGVTAGAAATATVARVRNASNAAVEGVTVTATVTTGSGTLDVASAVTDASGDASFTYTTHTTVETATLRFAFTNASGAEVAVTTTISTVAGAATKLVIATQPASNGNSGDILPGQPIIHVTDANGNVATGATNSIAAAIGTGNATVQAGTPKAAVAGIAAFTALTLGDSDGGANTIVFSTAGLTSATSTGVTLAPPVPVAVQFVTQPNNVTEDVAGLSCAVWIVDENNALVTGATNAVTVALTSAGGATLSGTLTVNAVAGVASFSGLAVDTPGTYTLTPSSTGLTALGASSSFTVSAAGSLTHPHEPAGMTVLTNQPWDAVPGVNTPDAYGWYRTRTGSQSIVVDATAPHSPSNVLSMNFGQNLSGGTAPLDIVKAISGTARKRLYCHFALFLPTNWTNSGNSGTKFFFVAQHSNTNHLVDLVRGGSGTGNMMSMITQHNGNGSLGQEVSGGFTGAAANRNRWLDIEIEMLANTPGTSNGEYHVWLDGVKRATHTNLLYFLSGQTPYWNAIRINPTYGGGSGQPPAGGLAVKVDHFYASVSNS